MSTKLLLFAAFLNLLLCACLAADSEAPKVVDAAITAAETKLEISPKSIADSKQADSPKETLQVAESHSDPDNKYSPPVQADQQSTKDASAEQQQQQQIDDAQVPNVAANLEEQQVNSINQAEVGKVDSSSTTTQQAPISAQQLIQQQVDADDQLIAAVNGREQSEAADSARIRTDINDTPAGVEQQQQPKTQPAKSRSLKRAFGGHMGVFGRKRTQLEPEEVASSPQTEAPSTVQTRNSRQEYHYYYQSSTTSRPSRKVAQKASDFADYREILVQPDQQQVQIDELDQRTVKSSNSDETGNDKYVEQTQLSVDPQADSVEALQQLQHEEPASQSTDLQEPEQKSEPVESTQPGFIRLNNIATIKSNSPSSASSNSSEMRLMRIYVIDLDQKLVVGGSQAGVDDALQYSMPVENYTRVEQSPSSSPSPVEEQHQQPIATNHSQVVGQATPALTALVPEGFVLLDRDSLQANLSRMLAEHLSQQQQNRANYSLNSGNNYNLSAHHEPQVVADYEQTSLGNNQYSVHYPWQILQQHQQQQPHQLEQPKFVAVYPNANEQSPQPQLAIPQFIAPQYRPAAQNIQEDWQKQAPLMAAPGEQQVRYNAGNYTGKATLFVQAVQASGQEKSKHNMSNFQHPNVYHHQQEQHQEQHQQSPSSLAFGVYQQEPVQDPTYQAVSQSSGLAEPAQQLHAQYNPLAAAGHQHQHQQLHKVTTTTTTTQTPQHQTNLQQADQHHWRPVDFSAPPLTYQYNSYSQHAAASIKPAQLSSSSSSYTTNSQGKPFNGFRGDHDVVSLSQSNYSGSHSAPSPAPLDAQHASLNYLAGAKLVPKQNQQQQQQQVVYVNTQTLQPPHMYDNLSEQQQTVSFQARPGQQVSANPSFSSFNGNKSSSSSYYPQSTASDIQQSAPIKAQNSASVTNEFSSNAAAAGYAQLDSSATSQYGTSSSAESPRIPQLNHSKHNYRQHRTYKQLQDSTVDSANYESTADELHHHYGASKRPHRGQHSARKPNYNRPTNSNRLRPGKQHLQESELDSFAAYSPHQFRAPLLSWETISSVASGAAKRLPSISSLLSPFSHDQHQSAHFAGDVANFHRPYPLRHMNQPPHLHYSESSAENHHPYQQADLASSSSNGNDQAESIGEELPELAEPSRPSRNKSPVNATATLKGNQKQVAQVLDLAEISGTEGDDLAANDEKLKWPPRATGSQLRPAKARKPNSHKSVVQEEFVDEDHATDLASLDEQLENHQVATSKSRRRRPQQKLRPASGKWIDSTGESFAPDSTIAADDSAPDRLPMQQQMQQHRPALTSLQIGQYKITPQTQLVQSIIEPSRQMFGQYLKQYINQLGQFAG